MTLTPESWKQIDELYNAVADLDPDERMTLLAQATSEVSEAVGRMLRESPRKQWLDRTAWEGRRNPGGKTGIVTKGIFEANVRTCFSPGRSARSKATPEPLSNRASPFPATL